MNLHDIRPADILPQGPAPSTGLRSRYQHAMQGYGNVERLFGEAYREGKLLRLTVSQKDRVPNRPRDSKDIRDYTIGSTNALYRASVVLIEMSDGRRWVHKDHNGPQECWLKEADTVSDAPTDPLQLLAEVSKDLCAEIIANYESTSYAEDLPEWRRLRMVQKILMREGRHVPSIVDEVVDIARAHGGLKH